jgi:hypothetical protein
VLTVEPAGFGIFRSFFKASCDGLIGKRPYKLGIGARRSEKFCFGPTRILFYFIHGRAQINTILAGGKLWTSFYFKWMTIYNLKTGDQKKRIGTCGPQS